MPSIPLRPGRAGLAPLFHSSGSVLLVEQILCNPHGLPRYRALPCGRFSSLAAGDSRTNGDPWQVHLFPVLLHTGVNTLDHTRARDPGGKPLIVALWNKIFS
jgi:hypothetical protein